MSLTGDFRPSISRKGFMRCDGCHVLFYLTVVLAFLNAVTRTALAESTKEEPFEKNTRAGQNLTLSPRDIYIAGFQVKRAEQLNAVKRILLMPSYEKQYSIVKIVLGKLFSMLEEAKPKTVQSGYIPGGEFPSKREDQEALGLIFENIAFFGDILLRLPKITHELLQSKKEWNLLVKWGVSFCSESGIFTGANENLLDLVAQELNLVPRDPSYVNPYSAELREKPKDAKAIGKTKGKAAKVKKKRGPRLSKSEL